MVQRLGKSKLYYYHSVNHYLHKDLSAEECQSSTQQEHSRPLKKIHSFLYVLSAWEWGSTNSLSGKVESFKPFWPFATVRSVVWRGEPTDSSTFYGRNITSQPPFRWTLNFLVIHTPFFITDNFHVSDKILYVLLPDHKQLQNDCNLNLRSCWYGKLSP